VCVCVCVCVNAQPHNYLYNSAIIDHDVDDNDNNKLNYFDSESSQMLGRRWSLWLKTQGEIYSAFAPRGVETHEYGAMVGRWLAGDIEDLIEHPTSLPSATTNLA
jgi:hypothetical protein